jgi:hypothetical protein
VDLGLYGRVIWRFKWIFFPGLLLAIGLAVVSTAKVDFSHGMPPKLTYRKPAQYRAQALMLVTQPGFPEGRSSINDMIQVSAATKNSPATLVPRFADPSRYSELALLYSTYVTSDEVQREITKTGGPIVGKILANPIMQPGTGSAEPIIDLAGIAPSKPLAIQLAKRAVYGLQAFIQKQQAENGVPVEKRAIIQPLNMPTTATVYAGHKKTKPAFVFLAVLIATLGICFILENLRPRVRVAEEAAPPVAGTQQARRSASA